MKKAAIRFLILFCLGLSGYYTYQNSATYLHPENPAAPQTEFRYIFCAVIDKYDNLYCIDRSKQRITKSRHGQLEYVINPGKRRPGSSVIFSDLAVSDDGYLFVEKTTLIKGSVAGEEIVMYPPQSPVKGTILCSREYHEDDKPQSDLGRWQSLRYADGYLYFFIVDDSDRVIFRRLSVRDHTFSDRQITIPVGLYPYSLTGVYSGPVCFSTRRGEIFTVEGSGPPVKIYPLNQPEIHSPGKPNPLNRSHNPQPPNEPRTNPVYLGLDSENRLYFADVSERRICRLNPKESFLWETVLSEPDWQGQAGTREPLIIKLMSVDLNGNITAIVCDQIVIVKPDTGTRVLNVKEAEYTVRMRIHRCLVWLWPVLFSGSLVAIWIFLYRSLIRKRIFAKQMAIVTVVMLLSMLITSGIILWHFYYNSDNQKTTTFIAQIREKLDSGIDLLEKDYLDSFEQITKPGDFQTEPYCNLKQFLKLIQGKSNPGNYSIIYKVEKSAGNNIFYMLVTDYNYRNPYYPYYPPDSQDREKYDRAVNEDQEEYFPEQKDAEGDYLFFIKPIHDKQGKVSGLYEMGIDKSQLIDEEYYIFRYVIMINLLIFLSGGLVIWISNRQLLVPLQKLTQGVEAIATGNLDLAVAVHSGDEIEKLGIGFNTMAANLKDRVQKIEAMRNSYARFVPKQFGEFLHVPDMTDIQLGAQAACEMGVMFSSIRSFYEQLKKQHLTPQESFRFINDFLKRIGPVIPAHDGFISDYLGAGIIALFPRQNDAALKAALEMRRQLEQYNQFRLQSNQPAVDIGIAIHRCPMILGIAGEENRLEGTVISEGVALAQTLEQATAKFGAAILITESILQSISNRQDYQYRYMGLISWAGGNEPTPVYDLYQGDIESIRRIKHDTREEFEAGVKLYQQQQFQEAKIRFINVIKRNNQDEAAKIYFFLCDEFTHNKIPPNWNGSVE
jgi:adenylate cyclase